MIGTFSLDRRICRAGLAIEDGAKHMVFVESAHRRKLSQEIDAGNGPVAVMDEGDGMDLRQAVIF